MGRARYLACSLAVAVALGAAASLAGAATEKTSYEWSIDLDCTECHATQAASMEAVPQTAKDGEEAELGSYVAMHAEQFGLTCVDCHEDTKELAAGHKKLNSGKEATRLRKSSVGQELCLTCHKTEDLAKATVDSDVLVDKQGTVVNPHDLPQVKDHATLACVDCHRAHEQDVPVAESAMAACTGCHHAEVFECGTCH